MAQIKGPPANATRNQPISKELERILTQAADATGIDVIDIVSGGQPSRDEGGSRTGSTRHDHGRAADCKLIRGGQTMKFTDTGGGPEFEAFVTAVAAAGATGIGAGEAYMGRETIHVGFGTSPSDHLKLVWGADGQAANAPDWLRAAAQKGWSQAGGTAPVVAAAPAGTNAGSS
jgi:hypothetical protein